MNYRYSLSRDVNLMLENGAVAWIMLNPSTADETADDPTIRKVRSFSYRAGYSAFRVVNLYPLRATDPKALLAAPEDVRLGDVETADRAIAEALEWAHDVVLAWGAHGDRFPERVARVRELVAAAGKPAFTLGNTKGGQPKHPLYISYMQPFLPVTS